VGDLVPSYTKKKALKEAHPLLFMSDFMSFSLFLYKGNSDSPPSTPPSVKKPHDDGQQISSDSSF